MDAEKLLLLNVGDALELPGFSPNLRALIELLDTAGPDVTIRDCADALGTDPIEWARRLVGEMVLAEVARLTDEAARKGAMN